MTRNSYKHFEMSFPPRKFEVKPAYFTISCNSYFVSLTISYDEVNEKCLSLNKKVICMKDGLLTERQMEVLRYRKQGLTQQQIADIISTSKANVCTIEKSAMENIRRAKETLEFLYTLDATHLCTIPSGTDLFNVPCNHFRRS